jgi:GT2 family glycosyltransferase
VVVATRDRPHLLAGLLDSLAGLDVDELLVVDSAGRDDATVQLCHERGVRVLRLDRPGTSRARNAGWRATTTALVAFTDDDCLPAPGWPAALRAALARSDALVGRVLPDRQVAAPVSVLDEPVARDVSAADLVGHGANCGFRRTALEQVGGFDESLGPGTPVPAAEDADLLRRVLAAGLSLRYDPAAVVVHRQWRSRRQSLATAFRYGLGAAATGSRRAAVWDDALLAGWRDARAGYATGVAVGAARAAGAVVGSLRGRRG